MAQHLRTRLAAATLVACLSAPAMAQVTAQMLLEEWQDLAGTAGQELVIERLEGLAAGLRLEGVAFRSEAGTARIGWMELRETGDGRVIITADSEIVIEGTFDPDGLDEGGFRLTLSAPGYTTEVSGDATERLYAASGPLLTIALDLEEGGGEALPMDFVMEFSGLAGSARMSDIGSGFERISYDLRADTLSMLADALGPDGGHFRYSAVGEGFSLGGSADVVPEAEMAEMLAAGFRAAFQVALGPGESHIAMVGGMESDMIASGRSEGSSFGFALSAAGVSGELSARGIMSAFAGEDLPFPSLETELGEFTVSFALPLARTDAPAPFDFALRLVDLRLDDMLYAMLDPSRAIPRDALTMILDIGGTGRWFVDVFDDMAMAMADEPGELLSLVLRSFQLRAAGLEASGEGRVEFDNSDMMTYDGLPKPEGSVDIVISGAERLLESLVMMGFLDSDMAGAARMGMTMFAVPDGPDRLRSRIEFTADGRMLANGERLR